MSTVKDPGFSQRLRELARSLNASCQQLKSLEYERVLVNSCRLSDETLDCLWRIRELIQRSDELNRLILTQGEYWRDLEMTETDSPSLHSPDSEEPPKPTPCMLTPHASSGAKR